MSEYYLYINGHIYYIARDISAFMATWLDVVKHPQWFPFRIHAEYHWGLNERMFLFERKGL